MSQIDLYDTIVIGGGPAGSTTATTLARSGHRVLVLEKAKFPRDHVGESLLPFCYQMFEELGVLENMKADFTRKPGVTFSNIDGSNYSHWCFSDVIKDPSYLSFHVHRAKFDNMLLENSRQNGAEVLEETKVSFVDFQSSPDFVVVQAEDKNGDPVQLKSRFVVDASGQDSLLAKQLKCKQPYEGLHPRVAYSTHWVGGNWDDDLKQGNIKIVHLEGEKLGWLWMIPLGENRLSIGLALNMSYAKTERQKRAKDSSDWQKELYLDELQSSPLAAKIIEGGSIAQPLAVNGDFSYFAAEKYGDRYAIVGDAAGFLDPIFSSGIYLGMKGGQRVAMGIDSLIRTGDNDKLSTAYQDLEGAYQLVGKLIKTFYQPGSIRFSEVNQAFDQSYDKFESAYSILHLVLAGDFFTNHQKYLKAISLLQDKSMIEKYRNLIRHPEVEQVATPCQLEASELEMTA